MLRRILRLSRFVGKGAWIDLCCLPQAREVGEAGQETHFAIPGLDLIRISSRPRKLVYEVTPHIHVQQRQDLETEFILPWDREEQEGWTGWGQGWAGKAALGLPWG